MLENAVHACAQASAQASAQRAGHDAGHIRLLIRRVGAASGGDAVEITLSDDGGGIPRALRSRVLEPFFTTKPQGTGLGLAVARAVAQAHRGVLWIDSEEGVGTTVGMRLPLHLSAHLPAHLPVSRASASLHPLPIAAADAELRRNAG